jgi:hypothetical protein
MERPTNNTNPSDAKEVIVKKTEVCLTAESCIMLYRYIMGTIANKINPVYTPSTT